MITCVNVSKTFGGQAGIRGINCTFSPGRIYGVIGANGAGKTTLLRCIEGLYRLTAGTITHDSISTGNDRAFSLKRKRISFLPNDDFLYPKLTCRENITLLSIMRGDQTERSKEATEELIDYFEIRDFLDKPFGMCSTGMKKKTQIIATLTGDIETIIWDEPNDGLDIMANIKMKELLARYKEQGRTVIISSHVIEFLEHFIDACIIIHEGKVMDEREGNGIVSLQDHYLRTITGKGETI
jgi:ABC-type multidrug transport system ATPase subunit